MQALMWMVLGCAWMCLLVRGTSAEVVTAEQDLPSTSFPHRMHMDTRDGFLFLWRPAEEYIEIEIQVATRGYVGLGFSPSGGMKGADIVLGWVADGEVVLHDRHAEGYMTPYIDASQDVTLVGGYENDTHTVIRFTRPWNTCDDKHDLVLGDDTVRVIWAYGYMDPLSASSVPVHHHRGTKSVYLKQPQFQGPILTPDIKTFDLRSDNVTLPDNVDTLYWCKLFKVPQHDEKHQIIGVTPIVEEANIEYVHHILVYECHIGDNEKHYEKWLAVDGLQCASPNMPASWKYCRHPLLAWAVGGQGDFLPPHVGFPMGEAHGGSNYIMIEIHYDNPNLRSGVVDNSGLRVYYTDRLRKYDGGVMQVGHSYSANLVIPPRQQNWTVLGHCAQSCTQQVLPREGIHVFQGILHSHTLGGALALRHIRDGEELPTLLQDKYYDFNFQQTRTLKEERTIFPGDSFLVQCSYDSSARDRPTFGGLGTEEEMCVAFINYYPKITLHTCMSNPTMDSIIWALGISDVDIDPRLWQIVNRKGEVNATLEQGVVDQILSGNLTEAQEIKMNRIYSFFTATEPEKYAKRTMYDILYDSDTWANERASKKLVEAMVWGKYDVQCGIKLSEDVKDIPETEEHLPKFTPYQPKQKSCRKG